MLRLAAIVMLVYAGMLGLTWWHLRTPTGFIPQQDKGYPILNVQLPESASLPRTEKAMADIEAAALKTPGVAHTVGMSGTSLILGANAPNLGSLYIMLDGSPSAAAGGPGADSDRRRARRAAAGRAAGGAVVARSAPPIDGWALPAGSN